MTNEVVKEGKREREKGWKRGGGGRKIEAKERIVIQSHFYALQIFILVICIIAAVCLKTTPHYVYVIKIVTDKTLIKKRYPKFPPALPLRHLTPRIFAFARAQLRCDKNIYVARHFDLWFLAWLFVLMLFISLSILKTRNQPREKHAINGNRSRRLAGLAAVWVPQVRLWTPSAIFRLIIVYFSKIFKLISIQ